MVAIPDDVTLEGANAATDIAAGDRSISLHGNRIDSRDLFTSGREITIAHGDDTYRLRLTSQNKLILTK
jgi:hemin uptake protein HemP